MSERENPFAVVDRNLAIEWPEGRAPGRAAREFAMVASMNGGERLGRLLNELCDQRNRDNFESGQIMRALRALLHALHAHPSFGGPHLSLEDAIAEAIKVLPESIFPTPPERGGGR